MVEVQAVQAERLRYVTRRYTALQGLRRLVWVGPLLAWLALEVQPAPQHAWFWLLLASLPAAALGSWLMHRWYARAYGTVVRTEHEWSRVAYRVAAVVLGAAAIIVVFNWRHPDSMALFAPEFGWAPLLVAAVVGAQGWTVRRIRRDRLEIAAGVALVGLLPMGVLTGGVHPLNWFEGLLATIIATLCATSIADHRFLTRTLAAEPQVEEPV